MRTEFVDYDKSEHKHTKTTRKVADIRIGRSPVKRIVDHYKERLSYKWALVGTYRDRDGMRHDILFRVVYTPEEAVSAVREIVENFPEDDRVGLSYNPDEGSDLATRVWITVDRHMALSDEERDVVSRIYDAIFIAKRCNEFLDYAENTCEHERKGAKEARNDG